MFSKAESFSIKIGLVLEVPICFAIAIKYSTLYNGNDGQQIWFALADVDLLVYVDL